jgi:sugar phosphate isomerase/epimerase
MFLQTGLTAGAAALTGVRCGSGGEYAGWDLCIATWGFRYYSGPEVAAMLGELNADSIDLISSLDAFGRDGKRDPNFRPYHENPAAWQTLKQALQQHGVKPFQYDAGLNEDMDENRRKFEWAKAEGFKSLMCAPPYDALDGIDKLVEEYDLYASIHNHGPTDKLYGTIDQCVNALRGHHPNLGMCVDVGHFWRFGQDPVRALEALGDRVHYIHLKDQTEVGGKEQAIVGEGGMDIPAILRTLKKINYDGPLGLEYEKDPENPMPGVKKSLENIRQMCRELS